MSNLKDIRLVCEDEALHTFVYNCISQLGMPYLTHRVKSDIASCKKRGGNRTDAINRVLNEELPAWKSLLTFKKAVLIIAIDADEDSIEELRAKFPTPSKNSDFFVTVIPKRNIQTWVALGKAIAKRDQASLPNENDDYKKTSTKTKACAKKAAKTLISEFIQPSGSWENTSVWQTFHDQMSALKAALKYLDDNSQD